MGLASTFRTLFRGILFAAPPYIAFTDIFCAVKFVEGASMQPTFNPDGKDTDFVLLDKLAASSMQFQRGEVVALISPKDADQWLIKRIVALEGDQVISSSCLEEVVNVPKGHIWVEGDNRDSSLDSNNFGPVSMALVTAKATHVLWPPEHYGRLQVKPPAVERVTLRENVDRGKVFFGWED